MRLRENDDLRRLAEAANKDIKDYGKTLIDELVNRGWLTEEDAQYGWDLEKSLYTNRMSLDEVAVMFKACGHKAMKSWMVDTLLNELILMDDYDCPFCGGKLIEDDLPYTLDEDDAFDMDMKFVNMCEICEYREYRNEDYKFIGYSKDNYCYPYDVPSPNAKNSLRN